MKENQRSGKPVHEWWLAEIPGRSDWIDSYGTVAQFMATDLFTVRPDDVLALAASLMEWRKIRHVPVEDDSGSLVGLVSHRDLIRIFARGESLDKSAVAVRDVMKTDLITVDPDTTTLAALTLMRDKQIGALPVVSDGKLLGIITAHDFLTVSSKLLEERLQPVCIDEALGKTA